MYKIALKQSVKKRSLILTFFVLFGLFMSSENGFAQKFDIKEHVDICDYRDGEGILFDAEVYDYSSGPNKHQYLQSCTIEFLDDKGNYRRLLDVKIPKQNKSDNTKYQCLNKIKGVVIEFDRDVIIFEANDPNDPYWPASLRHVSGTVPNNKSGFAVLAFAWRLNTHEKNTVRYLQISGSWVDQEKKRVEYFKKVVYDVRGAYVKKPKASDINAEISNTDAVNVFKESEDIVIKGAEPGENIKVFNTSGVEIKSVISNNDVVKIKLPAKQLYLVHVGNSQYKVAM